MLEANCLREQLMKVVITPKIDLISSFDYNLVKRGDFYYEYICAGCTGNITNYISFW